MTTAASARVIRWAAVAGLLVPAACRDDDEGAESSATTRAEAHATEPITPTTIAEPTVPAVSATSAAPATAAPPDTTSVLPRGTDPLVGLGAVEPFRVGLDANVGVTWLAEDGSLAVVASDDIVRLTPGGGTEVVQQTTGGLAGLGVDPEGRIVVAETGDRRVTRLEPDGTVTPLAESFEGAAFNGPAGVAVRSDGSVYFTDPGIDRSPQQEFRGVFRIAPDGTVTAEHRGAPSEAPFSLALSPDERQLYLSDANYNIVRVFDVAADGTLSEAREFVTPGGKPFGLAVDDRGNVYVSVSREQLVEVFAPDGSRWGAIPVPGQGLPMFFGTVEFGGPDGRTLYITAPGGIYQVTLAQP